MELHPVPLPMNPTPSIDVRSYGPDGQSHRHGYHQLVLPLTGAMEVDTPAGIRAATGATGVLIAAGERHDFRCEGRNRFVVVGLSADTPGHLFDRAYGEPELCLSDAACHHVALITRCGSRFPLSGTFREHWTSLLLEFLGAGVRERVSAGRSRLRAALDFIEAHAEDEIGIRDVAAATHISPSGLAALFRRHGRGTPGRAIINARLQRAAELLERTDAPIAEIATRCGFSEHSALTRSFRARFAETPIAYRRRRRSDRATYCHYAPFSKQGQ